MTTVKVLCVLLLAQFGACASVGDCPIREHMSVIENGIRAEGYWSWSADDTSVFPWPCRASEWSSRSAFIEKLHVLERYARVESGNLSNIGTYTRVGAGNLSVTAYRGMSYSRVDGSVLGNKEYSFRGADGKKAVVWPDSLRVSLHRNTRHPSLARV